VPGCTWGDPKRGDIVVFFSPEPSGTRLVKRVIGVPGDTLMLRNNHLYINGVAATYSPLDPKYTSTFSDSEKQRYRFALETYDGRSHPIMEMPERYNPQRDFGPIPIPAGKYFMMGDDRDNSRDSRYFTVDGATGSPRIFVDRNDIVGKATAVAISVDLNHHWLPRWSRFFSKLP
jgi:signal peptidase I